MNGAPAGFPPRVVGVAIRGAVKREALARHSHRLERFAQPAEADQLRDPLAALDSNGWLAGEVAGRDVLCLGAGGGKQSALFATAGARVTVVDLSAEMLVLGGRAPDAAAARGLLQQLLKLEDQVREVELAHQQRLHYLQPRDLPHLQLRLYQIHLYF